MLITGVLGISACADPGGPPCDCTLAPPSVTSVSVSPNPENALSAIVTIETRHAYAAGVACAGSAEVAPLQTISDTVVHLTLLSLAPGETCQPVLHAVGVNGTADTMLAPFTAGVLPAGLEDVHLALTGRPPPGYTLLEVSRDSVAYIAAFDTAGEIRWYRRFAVQAGEFALNAAQQANGDFTVYIGKSTGSDSSNGRFDEVSPDGALVRSWTAPAGLFTDPHELLVNDRDGVPTGYMITYDFRSLDLTGLGGLPTQTVAGHTLLHLTGADGADFRWSAWDHVAAADWLFAPPNLPQAPVVDLDHANSLAIAADGNIIASFLTLGEVDEIDRETGHVLWRFGGIHNQFTIVGDPLGGFGPQHDVRELPNGDLLMFDNGIVHAPAESRAVEYRLDTQAMTATFVWEYRHSPPLVAPFVGSARRLANGHTLVGFGALSRVVDVAPDGAVTWEGQLMVGGKPATYFYRATRLASLYRYDPP
jgi:hypothetical protein